MDRVKDMAVAAATQAVIEHVANVQRLQGAIAALHKVDEEDRDNFGQNSKFYEELIQRQAAIKVADFEEVVVRHMSDAQFQKNFRLTRAAFMELEERVEQLRTTKKGIATRKKLLIFLEYMANGAKTLREIGMLFGMSEAWVLKVIREMADTISSLSADIIQWPAGDGVTSTTKGFQGMSGIHGVIGAVDGSHIPIKCPRVDHECYFNRKKFYSLVLQAVCDHEMRFTDVFVGWPGSAHDTTVFDDSDLGRLSATNPSALFHDGTHLLGDKAYCLTPTLLIPYKEGRDLDNSSERLRFNKAHSSTRIVIEGAFGCMKGRFR